MRFDALVFDIDGTLWDSCEGVRDSWELSLRERFGCGDAPTLGQVRSIMGLTPDEIAVKLFSAFGPRAREVFDLLSVDECAYLAVHGASVYPGVPAVLRALAAERRLFIVSNCQAGYIEAFLASAGLEAQFEGHLCAGVTGLDKSGNLGELIRAHGLSRPVYIGDTRGDEAAARARGCAFIHAAYGFGEADAPDAVLRDFYELPAILRELEEKR